jgi:hypothetical protein
MTTLETQYKIFKTNNPTSTFSFEEWKEDFNKELEKNFKELETGVNEKLTSQELYNHAKQNGFEDNVLYLIDIKRRNR